MKKILIAVSAFAFFAAVSGMARAEGEKLDDRDRRPRQRPGGKKKKSTKKTDKAADGTGSTETKTETTKTTK